ncbi:MAG: hypothetical protein SFV32_04840 [Opitutaceae bacterium]|nr:hypothetical protein [Opitutaceae bacterium]
MNVVLVHGFLNRGSIMRSLSRSLEAAGHRTLTPSLSPCDGRCGIGRLAELLKAEVNAKFGDEAPLVVVGFSMGAIISRYYLQRLGGSSRTVLFASIAGPHAGTWTAIFYPVQGTREMRLGSPFLRDLNGRIAEIHSIPTVCYWSPFDLMIRPLSSACLAHAESIKVPALVHSLLLFDARLHRDLIGRLERISKEQPSAP